MCNIVCIIQARTRSSRLPNKVLLPLPYGSNTTVLEQVVNRVNKSHLINEIVVATTINSQDDAIEKLCLSKHISCFRGSQDNVLERYYQAALEKNATIVVRVTSDCPCIDYEIIDSIIEKHLTEKNDYTSNTLERSFLHGLDCEVFNFSVLEKAEKNATEKFEREHVTSYIYRTNKEQMKIGQLLATADNSNIRITLDTKEDYTLLLTVFDYLYNAQKDFLCADIINLFKNKPWLCDINSSIIQKKVCNNLAEELTEAISLLERQDLFLVAKKLKDVVK